MNRPGSDGSEASIRADAIAAHLASAPSIISAVIERLDQEDAAALPFVDDRLQGELLEAARTLAFRRARPIVGSGERTVYQDFEICMDVPPEGLFQGVMRATERLLNQALDLIEPAALDQALCLNDLVVQRYSAGSTGISPHRDHLRYVGIVALIGLGGRARFIICADRSGAEAREVNAAPGDLILMRAPGLFGRRDRPFHAVRAIEGARYSIGMRHDSTRINPRR